MKMLAFISAILFCTSVCAAESPLVAESKSLQKEITTKLKKYYASPTDARKLGAISAKLKASLGGDKSLVKEITAIDSLMRVVWASHMEITAIDNHMNMQIKTSGANNTTVTFKYALMSPVTVNELVNKQKIDDSARQIGFTRAIFTDGYDSIWTFKLDEKK